MRRMTLAMTLVPLTLALLTACKRDDGQTAGVATIRSGAPGGVRVTSAGARDASARASAADRVAVALCGHERRCAMTEDASPAAEAALLAEAVCVAEQKPRTRRAVEAWGCAPAGDALEACAAAIENDDVCRPIRLTEGSAIDACRPSSVCRSDESSAAGARRQPPSASSTSSSRTGARSSRTINRSASADG